MKKRFETYTYKTLAAGFMAFVLMLTVSGATAFAEGTGSGSAESAFAASETGSGSSDAMFTADDAEDNSADNAGSDGNSGEASNVETKTYTTGTDAADGSGQRKSLTWVQISDSMWTLDVNGDGKADVTLTSSINGDGEQVWTYLFNVVDNTSSYYIFEEMTKDGTVQSLPLTENYSSSGSDKVAVDKSEALDTDGNLKAGYGADYTDKSGNKADASEALSEDGSLKDGYSASYYRTPQAIPQDPGTTDAEAQKNGETAYTIQNRKLHSNTTGTLIISKKVDGAMKNPAQKFSFTVKLSGSTDDLKKQISGAKVFGNTAFVDGVGRVSIGNEENVAITDLPRDLSYEVTEDAAEGYTSTTPNNAKGTIYAGGRTTVNWINKSNYNPPGGGGGGGDTPEYVSFTLKNVVSGGGAPAADSNIRYKYTVRLEGLEGEKAYTYASVPVSGSSTSSDDSAASSGSSSDTSTDASADSGEGGGTGSSSGGSDSSAGTGGSDSSTGGSGTSTGDSGSDASTDDTSAQPVTVTAVSYVTDSAGAADVVVFLKAGESVTFKDLPVGATYQIEQSGDEYDADGTSMGKGAFIPSYIVSDAKGGTNIASSAGSGNAGTSLSTSKETADKGEEVTVTYTDNYPVQQTLSVRKVIQKTYNGEKATSDKQSGTYNTLTDGEKTAFDAAFANEFAKTFSFTVDFSNLPADAEITSEDAGTVRPDEAGDASVTFSVKADGTPVTFRNVPVGTKYKVTEDRTTDRSYDRAYEITTADASGKAVEGTIVQSAGKAGRDNSAAFSTDTETVDTNESDTVTFTNDSDYNIGIFKMGGARGDSTLSGAVFELLKCADGTTAGSTSGDDGKAEGASSETSETVSMGTATTGGDGFAGWTGLSAGTYILKETKAPDGYAAVQDRILVLMEGGTLKYKESADAATEAAALTDAQIASMATWDRYQYRTENEGKSDETLYDGYKLVDEPLAQLPNTGGSGTFRFLLIALAFGAAFVTFTIFTKKRA